MRDECIAVAGAIAHLKRLERTGPLAELRRLDRAGDGPPPEAFWWLVERAGVPPHRERFWQSLVPMMVTCPHRHSERAGHVLRAARVAPSRIERWLRLSAADARVELRKLLRRAESVDWVELSALLDAWEVPKVGDARRRQFARDFFLYQPGQRRTADSSATAIPSPEPTV